MNLHGRLLLASLLLPAPAFAGDLGDALTFIAETAGEEEIEGWEEHAKPDSHEALAMLVSRDIRPGAPLDSYDCSGSAIDQPVLRTSGEERWAHRYCMEARWNRDSLPGYRTLGKVRLKSEDVAGAIAIASRRTNVPAGMIENIIRFSSGYRPGVISNDGHYGLMQLAPEHLRAAGVEFGNLLDPTENIMAGAQYIARLTYRFGDLKIALAAYRLGPGAVEAAGGEVPEDRESIWFMREMLSLYYASIREVPKDHAVESMAFVWTWIE